MDIVSKGGSYLLDFGPMPSGKIQPEHVIRLRQIGAWLCQNGDAIYDTEPSPFGVVPFGGCTMKGTLIYLHLFDLPIEPLILDGLKNRVKEAYLLRDRTPIEVQQKEKRLIIEPAAIVPDPYDTIVVLEVEGKPEVETVVR